MKTQPKKAVAAFAEELADAYSTERYSGGWSGCIRMLRKRGYNDREIEAIIRSKWTRWAADECGKQYGHINGTDLAKFLDKMRNLKVEIASLVRGTFGEAA